MSKTKRTLAVVGVAALAVTGCSAASGESLSPLPEESTATTPEAAPSNSAQTLEDRLVTDWLNGLGRSSLDALAEALPDDDPRGHVDSYTMRPDGELVITVSGDQWSQQNLEGFADDFLIRVAPEHDELDSVTVEDEAGDVSATLDRDEHQQVK